MAGTHDWNRENLQDDSDDEDYLYEDTPRSCDQLLQRERHDSWRDPRASQRPHETTKEEPKPAPTKKDKTVKKQEKLWKLLSMILAGILFISTICLLLWGLYVQNYQECHLFLEEVTVTKLPERRFYISESVDLNLTLDMFNPNNVDGHLDHAYLRLSFIDQDKKTRYDVHEPVRLPTNGSILLPADKHVKYTFSTSVKIALLSEGLRVVMLMHNGCFTLSLVGQLTYRVASFPHTSSVNRTQQLFGPGACPFCGQKQ
eukprot:TRINITY_DN4087_c4_g1_i1.p1 TRINITY_DN4087_c4_g1~~TRINITY_DN4087_c4_g1_i1.p1  ORF type:complete len:258 (+),score=29.62 TRINITY_DN4087_c4_g1_i1:46-819(+)